MLKWFRVVLIIFNLGLCSFSLGASEMSLGAGTALFSGDSSEFFNPSSSFHLSGAFNLGLGDLFFWTNRLRVRGFYGSELNGENHNFVGFGFSASPGIRFDFSQIALVPFLEAGGLLEGYFVGLSRGEAVIGATALKAGFFMGIGVDWLFGMKRGSQGIGLELQYLYLASSEGFSQVKPVSTGVQAVDLEVRFMFGAP